MEIIFLKIQPKNDWKFKKKSNLSFCYRTILFHLKATIYISYI